MRAVSTIYTNHTHHLGLWWQISSHWAFDGQLQKSHFELFWALVANWLPDWFLGSGDKFATKVVSMYILGAAEIAA